MLEDELEDLPLLLDDELDRLDDFEDDVPLDLLEVTEVLDLSLDRETLDFEDEEILDLALVEEFHEPRKLGNAPCDGARLAPGPEAAPLLLLPPYPGRADASYSDDLLDDA